PPADVKQKDKAAAKDKGQDAAEKADESAPAAAQPAPDEPPAIVAAQPEIPERWLTLGSADPASPYRMLVTLTNRGAAVARVELNSPRFRNLEDQTGYLGHLAAQAVAARQPGMLVRVVGPGTPADRAGLKPGDVLLSVNGVKVEGPASFREALAETRPRQQLQLEVLRNGERSTLTATLERPPMEVVRPEGSDPLSLLLTLNSLDGQKLEPAKAVEADPIDPAVNAELPGLNLREGNWEVVSSDATHAKFRRTLGPQKLELIKTYRLAKAKPDEGDDQPAYHLTFDVEIRNLGDTESTVAYQLDGPTGLPDEGWWYATKISHTTFGGAGLRDVVAGYFLPGGRFKPAVITSRALAAADEDEPAQKMMYTEPEDRVQYIGIDAQYFAAVLLPQQADNQDWIAGTQPLRVGPLPKEKAEWVRINTSCRLISNDFKLPPGGSLQHTYTFFAGPKKPDILANYDYIGDLVYYGWFGWVSVPMLGILHFFHDHVVFNYGIAIIMLTVLVRSCMFPLSRKQALNAQRMQELQPRIKEINEKHKGNAEARTKATQELFRKHNYNPFSGCLPMFIQLPIFIGLYRSLSVDVELRQAALIPGLDWCSNLAAPDMLFYWGNFMPGFVISWLGPYFNLLPCFTVALFLVQQKMFMPPPTDEQTAMQQNMMKYMMVFIGVMFFKVASGLCIYFIASSLWGIAERKLLPKTTPSPQASGQPSLAAKLAAAATSSGGNGTASSKARKKERRGK
ncbi:MAG: YidC/Oxa1 family insertase periplasmic-domain containing protein, partial [Planctomycetes bacterium]|nr:YidC/Oxa1 family insertase periplasmic-domain containing protein [Planctomycetota bacterium]